MCCVKKKLSLFLTILPKVLYTNFYITNQLLINNIFKVFQRSLELYRNMSKSQSVYIRQYDFGMRKSHHAFYLDALPRQDVH